MAERLLPTCACPSSDAHRCILIRYGQRYELRRVGKKAAGRLLDGVEHNGFPEVR